VLEHFARPRNLGRLPEANGRGTVGDLREGPVQITIAILVERDDANDDRIVSARFRAFGCSAAIASASMATVLLEGKTVREAATLTPATIAAALGGLPEDRSYAPEFTAEAVHKALADWEQRHV
jgi:nitrogen fixation NifU-like protein